MRRAVFLLCLSSCLFSFQARANPANCDGDLSADQTEFLEYVVGLHPILFGGPIAIMRTCERVKKFLNTLSNLGVSRRTKSLSDEQVRSAFEGMRAGPGNVSSCLRSFDAAACMRYLGIGDSAATAPEAPTPPARTILTPARARITRDEVLLKDRELAANLVSICKSIMSAQTCEGRLLAIESLRDDVARMNKDPELMAFIPPITIDSPDLIAQTGWERAAGGGGWYNRAGNKADRELCPELTRLINGLVANAPERARERLSEFKNTCADRDPSYGSWLSRWETQLAGVSTRAGTKGGAYVRPEDCERLSRQIDADLRARPREEPASLSFFEVECTGDASRKYAGQFASWKQAIASRKGVEALNQWDGGIRQAEADQRKAKEEDERRIAAQKSAEEERQRLAAQRKRAEDEAAARQQANTGVGQSASKFSSVCVRNTEKIDQVLRSSGNKQYAATGDGFSMKATRLAMQVLTPCASQDPNAKRMLAGLQDGLQRDEKMCSSQPPAWACKEWGGNGHDAENQAWFRVFEREVQAAISNPGGYSADLDGQDARQARQSGSMSESRQSASAGADTAACEAAIQKSEREIAAVSARPLQGALASQQRVMWLTRHHKAAIDANCPASGKYATMRRELQQAYDTAAANCRQLKSGGAECTPER